MQNKHRISAFDIVAFIVLLALAFIAWSFIRAISLVQPQEFQLESAQRVGASAPIVNLEQELDQQYKKILEDWQTALAGAVKDFAIEQANDTAIYIEHLESGVVAKHNSHQEMTMASLYKPFVALEAISMVEADLLSSQKVILEDGRTVEECLRDTITWSDNPCGRALVSITNLGGDFGLSKLTTLGYKDTDLRGLLPSTTASDYALLLENIYKRDGVSQYSSKKMLGLLLDQRINDRLSLGLPKDADFAHKTGDLNGYSHDGGIVMDGQAGPYIIVVMSGPDNSGRLLKQRYASMGQFAEQINSLMENYSARLEALSS